MQGLRHKLYMFLKQNPNQWFHKSVMGELAEENGYMNETGTREARKLKNMKNIEIKKEATKSKSKTTFYRYIPSEFEQMNTNFKLTGKLI